MRLVEVQVVRAESADAGLSMAQLAIAWVLQQPGVCSAIVGGSKPGQLADSAAAAGVKLDPALLAAVDDILGDAVESTDTL